MARIFKIAKTWYVDYQLHDKRIRKRIGRSKRIAELALSEVERKLARANARELIYSFYEKNQNSCQICGYNLTIEEHHFIPRSQGGSNSPANLIRLCPNHHRLLHLGLQMLNGKRQNNKELKRRLEQVLNVDEDFALFYQRNAAQFEKMKSSKNNR